MSIDWPRLNYGDWSATCDTLHALTQLLGKLAVVLAAPEPQLQHAALRLRPDSATAQISLLAAYKRLGDEGHVKAILKDMEDALPPGADSQAAPPSRGCQYSNCAGFPSRSASRYCSIQPLTASPGAPIPSALCPTVLPRGRLKNWSVAGLS